MRVLLNVRLTVKIEEWTAAQPIDFGMAEASLRRFGFSTTMFSDRQT
jgi:hypothetical protein